MRPYLTLSIALFWGIYLASCSQVQQPGASNTNSEEEMHADGHTSENSLDWAGFYASEGTYLTLTVDQRYFFERRLPSDSLQRQVGKFVWSSDGRNITLPELNLTYWVREGNLALLDNKKQVIESEVLPKEETFLLAGPWRLAEINGRKYNFPAKPKPGENVFLLFDDAEKRVAGNSGCNRIFGNYENMDERLKFGKLGSTLMACQSMELEQEFTHTLAQVERFIINNGILVLTNDQGQPLLKFYLSLVKD